MQCWEPLPTTALSRAVEEALGGEHMLKCEDIDRLVLTNAKRMLTTGGHYASEDRGGLR